MERGRLAPSSAWSGTPWRRGDDEGINLNPLDDTKWRAREEAATQHCIAPPGSLSPVQRRPDIVPCSECPRGVVLDPHARELQRCKALPLCESGGSTCQLFAGNPFVVGPCETCPGKSYCDPLVGRKRCL